MQANYGAFQSALASIRQHVPPGSRVVELHAGVGAIGLSLFGPMAPQGRGSKGEARVASTSASDCQRKEGPVSLRWGPDYTGWGLQLCALLAQLIPLTSPLMPQVCGD